jgi:hypothetical protein
MELEEVVEGLEGTELPFGVFLFIPTTSATLVLSSGSSLTLLLLQDLHELKQKTSSKANVANIVLSPPSPHFFTYFALESFLLPQHPTFLLLYFLCLLLLQILKVFCR